ncbi:unnamed protein product [Protopolystoma xenopodis]|uniref:Uncharacterized protein n=1 Tax=Protopolystoma xenopodis TaxID=117903 RepID=A0A3S5A3Y5_9PLAT|nr:unnamed protein product [Protopolystoma xenopodis]
MQLDTASVRNTTALFVFLMPKGSPGHSIFVDPDLVHIKRHLETRCACRISAYDGDGLERLLRNGWSAVAKADLLQFRVDRSTGSHNPFLMGPMSPGNSIQRDVTVQDGLLYRGTWLIHIVYHTQPSRHHLFWILVNRFAGQLTFGLRTGPRLRRDNAAAGRGLVFTTLALLTGPEASRIGRTDRDSSRPSHFHMLADDDVDAEVDFDGDVGAKMRQANLASVPESKLRGCTRMEGDVHKVEAAQSHNRLDKAAATPDGCE